MKSQGKISGVYMEKMRALEVELEREESLHKKDAAEWLAEEKNIRQQWAEDREAILLRCQQREDEVRHSYFAAAASATTAQGDSKRLTKSLQEAESKLAAVTLHLEYEDAHRAILDRHLGLSEVPGLPKHLMDPKLLNKLDEKTQTTILTEVYRQKANGGQA